MSGLLINKNGALLTITFNRSEQHNTLNAQFISNFIQVINNINEDPTITIVAIKAQGPTFCGGADLKEMQAKINCNYEENLADAEILAKLFQLLSTLKPITLAVVQGSAYGGGVGLLSCCDMVLAAKQANFRLSEVKLGLLPAVISPYLIRAMGYKNTLRYSLTAETFSAEQAKSVGLVQEIADNYEALEILADQWINNLLSNGPEAMKKLKILLAKVSANEVSPEIIKHTAEVIAQCRVSSEGQEGLTAFMEKRVPKWNVKT